MQPHTNFRYEDLDEHPSANDDAGLHDQYAMLRAIIEFATLPQLSASRPFVLQSIGAKLLTLVYAVDPSILGVKSKDDLLNRMMPAPTRRTCELHAEGFRAHIRANRHLFRLGASSSPCLKISNCKDCKNCKNHRDTVDCKNRKSGEKLAKTTPGKESPINISSSVVPSEGRRSRAACPWKSATRDRDDRDGGMTMNFLKKLGVNSAA